jgi:hypothetical protein
VTPVYKLSASSVTGRTNYGSMLAGNPAFEFPTVPLNPSLLYLLVVAVLLLLLLVLYRKLLHICKLEHFIEQKIM